MKLLDFGLAVLRRADVTAEIAGTLGYMAPEVLRGAAASEASDLFAVGVMAHELLGDALPHSPQLVAVLQRAIEPSPTARYDDAAQLGRELAQATNIAPLFETSAIRDSFLQAAEFVARESELSLLRQALSETCAGRGAVILVGGESGIGKSRLLDELRTAALVQGVRVARGQAVSAGGAAFQVWQGPLRPLCLDEDRETRALDDVAAGVLRAAVPDIEMLLGRQVPQPPPLDPQNAQTRFLLTAEKLLLSQREPLVLLLEDLQWAEPASLLLLSRLVREVTRRKLLIVASYRDDERPSLPRELAVTHTLKLRRLSEGETAALSASMLGVTGRQPQLLSLLFRETEGNAFFIIEVLRALAEEAGALSQVGSGPVPARVVAGGVRAVLGRRLGRVPRSARPLLCAAAVLGRELDLAVLRALPLDVDALQSISACAEFAVLEVHEERWRFSHDKLREALLAELTKDDLAHWHHALGEAIERAYENDLGPHAAALAYHFDEAGALSRAVPYRLQAGERATRSGAMQEATTHLERALAAFDRVPFTSAQRSHALGLLCRAYHGAGRPVECAQILERLLENAGIAIPQSSRALFGAITRLMFAQLLQTHSGPEPNLRRAEIAEAIDAFTTVADAPSMTRSPVQLLHYILSLLHAATQQGDPARMAPMNALLGFALSSLPIRHISRRLLQRAWQISTQVIDPPLPTRAIIHTLEAVIHCSHGEWLQADRSLRHELDLRQRMGDWRQELFARMQTVSCALWAGEIETCSALASKVDELANKFASPQYICYLRLLESIIAMQRGELERATQLLDEAAAQKDRAQDLVSQIVFGGLSAQCALRRGDVETALTHADSMLHLLRTRSALAYGQIHGLHGLLETYHTLFATSREPAARAQFERRLRDALAVSRRLAVLFAVARPHALYWQGRYLQTRGHLVAAGWLFQSALHCARSCHLPFEEALAHEALAKTARQRGDVSTAKVSERAAIAIFSRLHAHWHLEPGGTPRYA